MVDRSRRLEILILALLLPWAGPAPVAAQTPASTASPTARPITSPRVQPSLGSLPSSVSPAIERFMRQNGQSVPPPPDPRRMAQGRQRVPSPLPPTTAPPDINPRADRGVDALPADLPPLPVPPAPAMEGRELVTTGPSPLTLDLILKPAPLEPTDLRFPINLATALRLADARPLIVASAQAGVWVAEAALTQAKVLWVPTMMIGFDYIRHDGGGPDFNKGAMTAPSVNYFFGGSGANLFVNLTDVIFEPLVARQMLNWAHWDVQSAKNDAVLMTTDAYFRVHQYRGMYSGALYCVERGKDLIDRIANLSRELVPLVEVERARNMVADLEQRAVLARQNWRVASADLTQVLRLDPRAVIVPLEHDHTQITLIDPGRSFDDLMPVALNNRPEVAARLALIQAAEERVRREKMRPLLPNVIIGGFQHAAMFLQSGIFGLGPNSSLNQFRGRNDMSFQLIWQLEGFGLGNLARIKQQRGLQSEAIIQFYKTQDMVAADVNRALSRVQSAAARVHQADRTLRTAIITFNGHLEGLEQTRRLENILILTFRPQEAVYSLDRLSISFNQYFTTVAEYNRAQFDLFHALGYPASEVTALRTPGPILPVNTVRPGFLPPVGNGPPPASR